jgi:hypothetical protein
MVSKQSMFYFPSPSLNRFRQEDVQATLLMDAGDILIHLTPGESVVVVASQGRRER